MNGAHSRRRVAAHGFTLIETLIALVLMGVVLATLATITAQWMPNWNRGFARVQRAELISIAMERLVSDLGAALFITSNRDTKVPMFDGGALSVTFVRNALGPSARPGLEIVRIGETADRIGPALVRSRARFAPSTPGIDGLGKAAFADPVVLLRAPYRVSFLYAGRDGIWKNNWQNESNLPALVRITLRDAASDRVVALSTSAAVHVDRPAECVRPRNKRDCDALAEGGRPRQPRPRCAELGRRG